MGRKQGPGDSVEIPTGQLHASVGQYDVLKVGRVVRRTNVAFPGKRRHRDGLIDLENYAYEVKDDNSL